MREQIHGNNPGHWGKSTEAWKRAGKLKEGAPPPGKQRTWMSENQTAAGATSSEFVTVVTTASELQEALVSESQHIEIQEHLDLTLWGWRNMTAWRAIWEIPAFVLSIRVRFP